MIVFSSETKEAFGEWRKTHPDWFVINEKSSQDRRLHRARCWHFTYDGPQKFDLSKKTKYCSEDRNELERWARKQGGGKLASCRHCL